MRIRLASLIASFAVVGGLAVAAPAQAAGNPVFVTPAPGATVPSGTTSLTADFSGAPAGFYWLSIACETTGQSQSYEFYNYASTGRRALPITALKGPDSSCRATLDDYDSGAYAAVDFAVAAPSLTLSRTSVSPATFYPLVRDGYRDTTKAAYTLSQAARVTAKVTNSQGRVVRSTRLSQGAGSRSWTWNGLRNDGTKAAAGAYRLSIVATSGGVTKSFSSRVDVKTAIVTRTKTIRRDGSTGAFATRGSCYASRSGGVATLDCWGGSYARATYRFRLPASAFSVAWSAPGAVASSDICCDGTIRKTGVRTSSTSFVVTATVTGWRAYEVRAAKVTYKVKQRI